MRKAATILFCSVLVLIFSLSLNSQERVQTWVDQVLKLIKPQPLDLSPRALAIHHIDQHLQEVAELRLQGLSEVEIAAWLMPQQVTAIPGSISGTVLWDQEHSLAIRAYDEYGRYAGSDLIFTSDVYGTYTIDDLPPGKYYVRTDSDYYEDRFYRNTTDWRKAKLVKVKQGRDTSNINLAVQPYWGEGTVTGHVRNKAGMPVSDCYVYLKQSEFEFMRAAMTDASGRYAMNNIPGGQYKLRCNPPGGSSYAQEWYSDALNYEQADSILVTEPHTTAGIDFVLEFSASMKGKVLDFQGKAVGAYRCSVRIYDAYREYIRSTSTDEAGSFKCEGLRPGAYKLYIDYSGEKNCQSCWYNNAGDFDKAKTVRLKPKKTKSLKIKLKKGGILTGQVVDYMGRVLTDNCSVTAYDLYRTYVKSTPVGADGRYHVQGLPTGYFKLYATDNGFYSRVGDQPAGEWYGGSSSFSEAQAVQVKAPETTSDIDFSLDQGGYIGGVVYPPGNRVLQWGSVVVYNHEGDWIRDGIITADGRYFVQGLASGEYRLRASATVSGEYMSQWYSKATRFEAATPISVTAPNRVPGIDIRFENPGRINGYILDSKKKRIQEDDQFVYMFAYHASNGNYAGFDTNTFAGGYSLKQFSGRYKVSAVSLQTDWQEGINRQAVGFYRKGTGFHDPKSQPVFLAAGATKKLKTLTMKNADGAISGTVYDATSNQPISDGIFIVWVFDEHGFLAKIFGTSVTSGSMTGNYIAPGLRPGTYYLLLWLYNPLGFAAENIYQWYGGVQAQIPMSLFVPKIDIPSGAYPVMVGKDETKGIDFHIER